MSFLCLDLTLALSLKILSALERWQVYKGDSSDLGDVVFSAAQFRTDEVEVQMKHRFRYVMKGKDTLSVTVSPDVDYSFVVALVDGGDT
ncbi:protein LURP-one-related 15-like [Primulina tabacum]|uniref:protein LURP-one-related 15-like n=1 Tax=Primulina tabacum TaxID=48773 RepID=UPI003F5A9F54